jgi:hypothetical protein
MDEQTTEQPEVLNVPEMTVYEQLYSHLYAYRFGTIRFLVLLRCVRGNLAHPAYSAQPAQPVA